MIYSWFSSQHSDFYECQSRKKTVETRVEWWIMLHSNSTPHRIFSPRRIYYDFKNPASILNLNFKKIPFLVKQQQTRVL